MGPLKSMTMKEATESGAENDGTPDLTMLADSDGQSMFNTTMIPLHHYKQEIHHSLDALDDLPIENDHGDKEGTSV